jgi:hypothetical protein
LIKLYSSNVEAQINLFWCLTNLMYNDTTVKEIICEKDGAITVLNTLRKHKDNKDLIRAALICLNQMAQKKYSRISISAEGGANDTFKLLKNNPKSEIELYSVILLATLSRESTGKKKIMESEMVPTLVEVLKNTENSKIQTEILKIFANLSAGAQSTKKALKALKLTAVLLESISDRFQSSPKLLKLAQEALDNLFKPSEYEDEIEETPMFTDDDIDFSFLLKENEAGNRSIGENDILKDFSESFQYEFESSTSDEVDLSAELNTMRDLLQKEQKERKFIEEELDSLRKYVIELNEDKDSVKNDELEKYKLRATTLEERYKSYKTKSKELEAEKLAHNDVLVQSKEAIKEVTILQGKYDELQHMFKTSSEELEILEPLVDKLREENITISARNDELNEKVISLKKQMASERKRAGEFEEEKNNLIKENAGLQQRIDEFSSKEKKYIDDIEALTAERDDISRSGSGPPGNNFTTYLLGIFAVGCLGVAVYTTYYFS